MKTEELVDLLATGAEPVSRDTAARRFTLALLVAALGALLLMQWKFGRRPDLASVAYTGLFLAKIALPTCIAIGALIATTRLSRPGAKIGRAQLLVGMPIALVWLAGATFVCMAEPQDRPLLLFGMSWRTCAFNILMLSIPGFIAVFVALRSLAPTNLRLAGASAGLLSSSIATIAYCLHCPEMSPAFWGIWYVLGMTLVAAIGAVVGPRLLRW